MMCPTMMFNFDVKQKEIHFYTNLAGKSINFARKQVQTEDRASEDSLLK